MIRQMGKCFFIHFLIFSVFLLQVGPDGIKLGNDARAQSAQDRRQAVDTGKVLQSGQSSALQSSIQKLANQEKQKYKAQNKNESIETASKKEILTAEMMSLITMIVMGVVASSLFQCKKKTADIYLVAGGGAAYIAGEAVAIMKYQEYKRAREQNKIDYTLTPDSANYDTQLKQLEEIREIFVEVQKAAKIKRILQMGAAAAFATAAAWAGYKAIKGRVAVKTCAAGAILAMGANATRTAACSAAIAAAGGEDKLANTPGPSSLQSFLQDENAQRLVTAGQACGVAECVKHGKNIPHELASCTGKVQKLEGMGGSSQGGAFNNKYRDYSDTNLMLIASSLNFDNKNYIKNKSIELESVVGSSNLDNIERMSFPLYGINQLKTSAQSVGQFEGLIEKSLNIIFPRAKATMNMIGLGAAATGVLAGMTGAAKKMTDKLLSSPRKRTIAWATLSGLAYYTAYVTGNIVDKMGVNIQKIDDIISRMQRLGKADSVQLATTRQEITRQDANSKIKDIEKGISLGGQKLDCAIKTKKGQCASLNNILEKEQQGFSDLPNSFGTVSSLTGQLSDGLSGTSNVSGATLKTGQNLANQFARVNRDYQKIKKRLLEQGKKDGSNLDVDKESSKFLKAIKRSIASGLKGKNGNKLLASFGKNFPKGNLEEEVDEKNEEQTADSGIKNSSQNLAGISLEAQDTEFNFKFDNADELKALDTENGMNDDMLANSIAVASLDQRFESSDDIVSDPNKSIFKVISIRYLKSGYARLLNRLRGTNILKEKSTDE